MGRLGPREEVESAPLLQKMMQKGLDGKNGDDDSASAERGMLGREYNGLPIRGRKGRLAILLHVGIQPS